MSISFGKNVFSYINELGAVNMTVKISVCGNDIAENGEDCDNADLQNRTCAGVGYSRGTLNCDISCSFDTTECVIPSIDHTGVPPENVSSLLASGDLSKPPSDSIISVSSLTATTDITINIPVSSGTSSIILPAGVDIARSDSREFDPTTLEASSIESSSLSGFSQEVTVDGALQWGIPSTTLEFSTPITLSIYVGTSLNGQTLNVVRSTSTTYDWTSDGIVDPATCTVSEGSCTFQATKASYYATNRTITATPTPTPTAAPTTSSGSSSSNGTSTTNSSTSNSIVSSPSSSLPIIPDVLKFYKDYLDSNGRFKKSNLFNVVKSWVDDWKEVLAEELAVRNNRTISTRDRKCDVNKDNRCDIKDLSVLLFYVEQ
jgi:hypothetical protein